MAEETASRYKDTVNLPKTDFQMKANLPVREPEMIRKWTEIDLYNKILKKNEGRPTFAMPDGPPYANGNIHIGHALNKILKDIVIKYKNLSGYQSTFIPGWDCHGLPIEQKVLKDLGSKAKEKSETEIRELCRAEARKWIGEQLQQFERLGILADWKNPYRTMDPEYEAEEVRILGKILEKGIFYRGEKPVYWCLPLQTALAEAEVEYHNHKSPSIYVKFPLVGELGGVKDVNLVIWTTTPWTLPANLGISLNPDFTYEIYRSDHGNLLIAQDLKAFVEQDTGIALTSMSPAQTFKGSELDLLKYNHPMYDDTPPGRIMSLPGSKYYLTLLGDHVTKDAGTGAVHTAPGHGQDDYKIGQQYGLPILSPVNDAGRYTNEVPEFEGKTVWEANPLVVEKLKQSGHLLGFKEIEHSYPHCWRTKTPLIFRATPQWFIRMDDEKNSLRQQALEAIKQVNWVPKWGENRITGMIENRPDWCLSRQRTWGVPIPVFYCQKCNHELTSPQIMNQVADHMEKKGGMEAYHQLPVRDLIGDQKCSKCGHNEFKKGRDILDVWFDSGVCWAAVQKRRKGLTYPADLYLEGSDQHRGWFHTSLLASIAVEGIPPFKTVLTHGFVMFAKGQKMSKSLGNVVDPREVMKQNGAETLRLWAAHEDYAQDLTCSPESLQRITETYRRLRNTMRFLLGNIGDFDPSKDQVAYSNLTAIDKWALAKLNQLVDNIDKAYSSYEFYKVYHLLNNFVTVELSAVYLDVLKDRLYTWKANGVERRAAQTVLYQLLLKMCGLMAPILTFLAEETYSFLPGQKKESIFLTDFPKKTAEWENPDLVSRFDELLQVRPEVSKVLEDLRQAKTIGSSLEAEIEITAEGNRMKVLESYARDLRAFFIVSKVTLKPGPFKVIATKSTGKKCARCWHYYSPAEENSKFPDACPKCVEALT